MSCFLNAKLTQGKADKQDNKLNGMPDAWKLSETIKVPKVFFFSKQKFKKSPRGVYYQWLIGYDWH